MAKRKDNWIRILFIDTLFSPVKVKKLWLFVAINYALSEVYGLDHFLCIFSLLIRNMNMLYTQKKDMNML